MSARVRLSTQVKGRGPVESSLRNVMKRKAMNIQNADSFWNFCVLAPRHREMKKGAAAMRYPVATAYRTSPLSNTYANVPAVEITYNGEAMYRPMRTSPAAKMNPMDSIGFAVIL